MNVVLGSRPTSFSNTKRNLKYKTGIDLFQLKSENNVRWKALEIASNRAEFESILRRFEVVNWLPLEI